jgi:hypothetical protein
MKPNRRASAAPTTAMTITMTVSTMASIPEA